MTIRYPDLTDYLAIAAEVTALDPDALSRVTNLHLADSALHSPVAGWAGVELYPEFVDNGAVLLVRLAKNHPLPDGNKRAAWVTLRLFIDINDWSWTHRGRRSRLRGRRGRVGRESRRRLASLPLAAEAVAGSVGGDVERGHASLQGRANAPYRALHRR